MRRTAPTWKNHPAASEETETNTRLDVITLADSVERTTFSPIRLTLLDSNDVSLKGMMAVYSSDPTFRIVRSSAMTPGAPLLLPSVDDVDLIVIDPVIAGRPAWHLVEDLPTRDVPVLIVTDAFEPSRFLELLLRGVRGYLLKAHTESEHLLSVAAAIARFSMLIIDSTIVDYFLAEPTRRVILHAPEPLSTPLTPRETEILELLAADLTDQQIAQQTGISVSTVESHVRNACRKLGASTRYSCAVSAFRHGLLRFPTGD